MTDLILLFNHTLTAKQEADARQSLEVDRIVEPPAEIKGLWSQVPADIDDLTMYLEPVLGWLEGAAKRGDFVLVQGEFGATCLAVKKAFQLGLVPVYSTTSREAHEEHRPDGSVHVRHVFSHVRFRRYAP